MISMTITCMPHTAHISYTCSIETQTTVKQIRVIALDLEKAICDKRCTLSP